VDFPAVSAPLSELDSVVVPQRKQDPPPMSRLYLLYPMLIAVAIATLIALGVSVVPKSVVAPVSASKGYEESIPVSRNDNSQQHRHLVATSDMLEKLQLARAKMMNQLQVEYGSYTDAIFKSTVVEQEGMPPKETTIGRSLFQTKSPPSWERLQRKLKIKILQGQASPSPIQFVWATGGHSSSAGHGNLFNESYTQILSQKATDLFAAVGLDFVARPHAMGGTSCGNEIAICSKEIFGDDLDFLSWDYGMTTGGAVSKVELYMYRAALLPTRPGFILLDAHNRYFGVGKEMQDTLGLTAFVLLSQAVRPLTMKFPDTAIMTQNEIAEMPTHVRAFRCGSGVEKGEPGCLAQKYTYDPDPSEPCNRRSHRVSWHPGWKWHAFYGNILTLFLAEALQDALETIHHNITTGGMDPNNLLDKLKSEDDANHKQFTESTLPGKYFDKDLLAIDDIPNDVIYRKPNFCHTARLPSLTRYQGTLTESPEFQGGSYEHYDRGYELSNVMSNNNANMTQMPLVWDPKSYQLQCTKYRVQIDYQDFFFANSLGESKLLLPNPSEKKAYGSTPQQPLQGYISLCLARCGWKCPPQSVSWDNMRSGSHVTMSLNGVPVQNYTKFAEDCAFLKHADGHKWKPDENEQFDIRMKTNEAGMYIRMSSLVIW